MIRGVISFNYLIQLSVSGTTVARQRRGATRLEHSKPTADRSAIIWGLGSVVAIALVISLFSGDDAERAELATKSSTVTADSRSDPIVNDELLESAVSPPETTEPSWQDIKVRNGDNLSLIFARAGFSDRDVYEVTRDSEGRALRKIYPGQTIGFLANTEGELMSVRHIESPLKQTIYTNEAGQYSSQLVTRDTEPRTKTVGMTIESSLFLAGDDAGLSAGIIMELAAILGGVIDFALDPRVGDDIQIVYQENFLDGQKFTDGPILAASFNNNGRLVEAFRYTDSQGDVGYFAADGVSMRKAFLRAPLDFTRVSSSFNPNRLHPIYKTKRPHRGTDYAAPRGTPVYAAGDGRVVEAGYSRPNGNYVFIQHGEGFKTHYLHLNRKRVKRGERVKQGQVIGTVGSTGAATGPHLHYEFLVNGVHRNPRTVHKILPKAKSLPDSELNRFRAYIIDPVQRLASVKATSGLAGAK